jgi:transposase
MAHFDLTDRQWERLEPLLSPARPRTGRPNPDHRGILNSI